MARSFVRMLLRVAIAASLAPAGCQVATDEPSPPADGAHRGGAFDPMTATTISPALAARLARHGTVHLPRITVLSKPVLEALCSKPCDLVLTGLRHLRSEEADVLNRHQGVLDFENLIDPSSAVLAGILRNQGPVALGSVTRLGDPASAAVLHALRHHRAPLGLRGLVTLTVAEAEAIRARTHPTDLSGIRSLQPEVAQALIDCESTIWLLGITHLPPRVIHVLLRHTPQPDTGLVFPAALADSLSRQDVVSIRQHAGLHFGNTLSP